MVSNTYCVGFLVFFLRLEYPLLPVALDCPFMIVSSACLLKLITGLEYTDGNISQGFRAVSTKRERDAVTPHLIIRYAVAV